MLPILLITHPKFHFLAFLLSLFEPCEGKSVVSLPKETNNKIPRATLNATSIVRSLENFKFMHRDRQTASFSRVISESFKMDIRESFPNLSKYIYEGHFRIFQNMYTRYFPK